MAVLSTAPAADCAACHAEIAQTYRATGMGRSFARLAPGSSPADFSRHNSFYHPGSRRSYDIFERDGRFFVRRSQTGQGGEAVQVVEKEAHYSLGSGNHAVALLHRTVDGRLIQLPVSWYADEGGQWAMAPGYDRPDHPDFRRAIDLECMFCHNAYPALDAPDTPGATVRFEARPPEGIDCARCHGSGEHHTAAAAGGEPTEVVRATILNPGRLSPARQLEICMQCHLETTTDLLPHAIRRVGRGYFSYTPSEPLADYALHFDHAAGRGFDDKFEVAGAAYRLRQSSCFLRSEGKLTCTACHDPHHVERGPTAQAGYDEVCQSCHAAAIHPPSEQAGSASCVGCHMPKRRAEDALHVLMTDHRIEARPPPPAPREAIDETGGDAYRGPVVLYYPPSLDRDPDGKLYLALAQVKESANLETGVERLARAIRDRRPAAPDFDYFLGEGLRHLRRDREAARSYREALKKDPDFWAAALGLGLALASSGNLADAAGALERGWAAASQEGSVAVALGDVYYRLGRPDEARETLLRALELDPDSPEAHNNLGAVYFAQRRLTASEAELREAIRHRPDYASAHANLAALLATQGRLSEAIANYEEAFRLGETSPEAVSGYAAVLKRLNRTP